MQFTKHTFSIVMFSVMATVSVFSGNVFGKSLYAVTKCYGSTLTAYDIVGDEIEYQIDTQIDTGAIGLALDPESETLFVTYDGPDKVVLVDAKTMQQIDSIPVSDELSGIVYDQSKQKIYAVSREDTFLYVYLWNPISKSFILEKNTTLENLVYPFAFGLALDEVDRIIYVTDTTNVVKYYDADDPNFGYLGSIEITVDSNDREAVCIDFYRDSQGNKYLYTGGWMHSTQHEYLVRTDINDVNNPVSAERYLGSNVGAMGIAIDQQTGYVYVTTSNNHIEVYNNAIFPSDPCDTETSDISGPADIIVRGDVSCKPPVFDVNKVDNVNDVDCVYPWNMIDENYLVYNICYDANGHADTNVIITDFLPPEVEYYSSSSDPCGVYHPNSNTVTWDINDISGADSNCLQLTVKVKPYARPGRTIINYCEMEGDLYLSCATEYTDICCYDIIYVDADANGYNTGTSWLDAYPDLQDGLETTRICDCEQIWVAQQTYKPTDTNERSISFEMVDNVAVYGGFPPGGGEWVERDPNAYETILSGDIAAPNDQSDNSYHVVKCEDVNNTILDGFTVTMAEKSGIYCQDCKNLTVANCIISDNKCGDTSIGGGIYFKDSTNLAVTNCNISDNTASCGGGLYIESSDPNVSNCIFSGNHAWYGGGIYIQSEYSSTITNCIFSDNSADLYGGGVYSKHSTLNVYNCVFTGNTVTLSNSTGAGMHNCDYSFVAITNCIFSGNVSARGGGINNDYSGVLLANCTVTGNAALYGGGMRNVASSGVNATNCIFWNNVVDEILNDGTSTLNVNYSDVKGGWPAGTGNIDKDPCFFTVNAPTGSWTENASYDSSTFQSTLTNANASWSVNELAGKFVNPDINQVYLQFFIVSNNVNTIKVWSDVESIAQEGDTYQIYDYHLTADSACIDTGDPDFNPDPNMTDIDGERRVVDGDANGTEIVDMGADEYYWSPADFSSDGIVNFFDYALFANVWQKTSLDVNDYNDIYDLVDNNCIDYNDLARFCEDWLWQRAWAKAFPFSYGQGMGKSMGLGMGESLGLTEEILPSAPAKKPQPQLTDADIEEIIKWLAELWFTEDELRKMMSEDEWLKFMDSVIQALKSQMQN